MGEIKSGLEILNCGAGHLEFSYDKTNEEELEKAKNTITDMLKRGYTILVEHDGETHRVESFDPQQEVYYIEPPAPKRKGRPRKSVPLRESRATAVGRTAGG